MSAERLPLAAIGDEAGPDVDAQVSALTELGWAAIELRSVGGRQVAELSRARVAEVAERVRRARLRVVAVSSTIGGWGRSVATPLERDLDELDALAPRALALGARWVRVMSFENDGRPAAAWRAEALDRLARLTDRAQRHGLTLLHENCLGWASQGAEEALELVARVGGDGLRLLLDVGNVAVHGQDPLAYAAAVADWVAHVHVKDSVGTGSGARFVYPGEGEARVAECMRLLHERGYRGAWSIEPHLDVAPHLGRYVAGTAARDRLVDYGRRFERFVRARVLTPVSA